MASQDDVGPAHRTVRDADTVPSNEASQADFILRLFVVGDTAKTRAATGGLARLCEEHLSGRYTYTSEIIDLLEQPDLATEAEILAVPTLLRQRPLPVKRIIGDLSNIDRVLAALGVRAGPAVTKENPAGVAAPSSPQERFVEHSRAARLGLSRFRYRND